jgi:hypothetical protein
MSDGLKCAYCREPLPEEVERNHGFYRCPTCRRILLVRDRLIGLKLGEEASPAYVVLLGLVGGCYVLVGLLVVARLTSFLTGHVATMLAVLTTGLCLEYDGWLSVRTRISRAGGHLRFGRLAVRWGIALILFGAAFIMVSLALAAIVFIAPAIWG